jgi:hypothetical protein
MSQTPPPPPPAQEPGSAPPQAPVAPAEAAPPAPKRRTGWIIAGVVAAVVVLGLIALVVVFGGQNTYEGNGVTFDYPATWAVDDAAEFQTQAGDATWTVAVGPESGSDAVVVSSYALRSDVGSVSPADLRAELENTFGGLVTQAGGQVTEPLSEATMGGLDGYSITFTTPDTEGGDLTTELTAVFEGSTQWNVQCQSHADSADEIQEGCTAIHDSFEVTASD